MANVIKLKYGSGIPGDGQLQTGELGLDLINKVIYTADGNDEIIELSRNMGEGGTIEWDQIVNVPIEIENIINGEIPEYGTLDVLIAQVKANADDIAALKAWETTAKGQISALEAAVAKNAEDIATNAGGISGLETTQGAQDIKIKANEDAVKDLDGRVTSNKGEIDEIKAALDKDLTGLVLAGTYSAASNKITSVKTDAMGAGFTENESLNSYLGNEYAGYYFIVDEAGKLANTGSPARADGDDAFVGDWLVSDGPHWLHFNFSQESTVWGTIGGDITAQDDLQDQFATKLGINDDIVGGTYTA
jgi:hypothetical protein